MMICYIQDISAAWENPRIDDQERIGGYKDRIGYKGKPLHFVLLHYIERKCIKYVNVVCDVVAYMGPWVHRNLNRAFTTNG